MSICWRGELRWNKCHAVETHRKWDIMSDVGFCPCGQPRRFPRKAHFASLSAHRTAPDCPADRAGSNPLHVSLTPPAGPYRRPRNPHRTAPFAGGGTDRPPERPRVNCPPCRRARVGRVVFRRHHVMRVSSQNCISSSDGRAAGPGPRRSVVIVISVFTFRDKGR